MISSSSERSIRWWGELVVETTMSASASWRGRSSIRTALPPNRWAREIARL
jgi:hypothetical protein